MLTLAQKYEDWSKDRSKVFYIQKTGTAVLEFCRTIGCPSGVAMQGKLEYSRIQIVLRVSITVLVFYHYLTS